LLVLVVLGLALVYVGGRLGLRLWRRRGQQVVFWRREAEWGAALHQIQLTRTAGDSNGSGKQPQRIEVGADFESLAAGPGGASQDRARGNAVEAR
jgi:hypothetical protein